MTAARGDILIAAISGRALAAAARRAGLRPFVADCFGDEDTRAIAECVEVIKCPALEFDEPSRLVAALQRLEVRAAGVCGVVLGAGFERRPDIIECLSATFRVIGVSAQQVRALKEPEAFFDLLDRLGVRRPVYSRTVPVEGDWLIKRVGGSGGSHIRPATRGAPIARDEYAQENLTGLSVSLLAVGRGDKFEVVGLSQQWPAPTPAHPYRYGGAVGPIELSEETSRNLVDASALVARSLQLRGLLSFDFILDGSRWAMLEVNARPGATLDVFDRQGELFLAHLASFSVVQNDVRVPAPTNACCATAIVYADDAIAARNVVWPEWTADRPAASHSVAPGDPLCTILACAHTIEAALALQRERMAILRAMLL